MTVWSVAIIVFLLNIPFGYWRARTKGFSKEWVLAVHLPVPAVIGLRFFSGLGWRLAAFPILFGAFFLLIRLRVFDRALWSYIWPLAIIGAGLWILFRPIWRPDREQATESAADDLNINQIFSGTSRKIGSQSFRGGKADVVFGSAEIDLRGAKLAGGQATLVLSAVFGSIEVYVPREWQVVIEGTPPAG